MTDRVTDSLDRPGSDSQVTRCQFSSKSRTDGRTDGLTKKNSPNDESSPNATPAGGLKESPIPDERQATRQLLEDAWVTHGERERVTRFGDRDQISDLVRRLVYRRDGWKCQRCGAVPFAADPRRRSGALHLDHIVPWSAGGSDRSDNLRTLCGPCNFDRSNRTTGREKPVMPIVRLCAPCHPQIVLTADKPSTAFDVYCACRHHVGWAIPGWQVL